MDKVSGSDINDNIYQPVGDNKSIYSLFWPVAATSLFASTNDKLQNTHHELNLHYEK